MLADSVQRGAVLVVPPTPIGANGRRWCVGGGAALTSHEMSTTVWRRNIVFNKKLLLGVLLLVAAYLGYRRYQSGQAEQDLWAEATDPIPPADPR